MNDNQKSSPEHSERVAKHMENFRKSQRRRQIRTANKRLKRNIQPKSPRRKQWEGDDYDQWEELDYSERERIMPLDESDRRRTIEEAAFESPGLGSVSRDMGRSQAAHTGTVVSVSAGLCTVEVDGREVVCSVRGSLTALESEFTNAVAVGDNVALNLTDDHGVIESVLPRRSALVRPDVFHAHRQQVLVANADQLLIVASWREPIIWHELIDRYIISAERSHLNVIICVTKADLIENAEEYRDAIAPYLALGHRVIRTSALTGEGIEEARVALSGKISVLAGLSGAGKSSLISAVQPGMSLRTQEVNEHSGEGRHTTTQATLHCLDGDGAVVDTPGIRTFGLAGLRKRDLAVYFPEIAPFAENCRFADCSHTSEPDCAVARAEQSGSIPRSRSHSYHVIRETLPE